MPTPARCPIRLAVAALGWLLAAPAPAPAQNDAVRTQEGLFVLVPSPITSAVVGSIRAQVKERVNDRARPVRTVVFDFNPDGKDVTNADFGACVELHRFLGELRASTTTVAFVHAKTTGHTVLPVLACKELAMGRGASLGEVVPADAPPLDKPSQGFYEAVAETRKAQWAAIRKTFDKDVDLAVGVLKAGGATWYLDRRNKAEVELVAGVQAVAFAPPGRVALYTAEQARTLGLCTAIAETRADVAEVYSLSPASTQDDPLQGRSPDAFRYTLKGEVDGAMRESVGRILRDIKRKKGNVLVLTLDCSGGDLGVARALADDLAEARKGDDGIKVVAYVPDQAPDAATFLAFGCNDIVMSKRRDAADPTRPDEAREAVLGDFSRVVEAGKGGGAVDAHRQSLRDLAEKRGLPGILADGMFDKELVIVRVHGAAQRNQQRLLAEAEFEANKDKWVFERQVKAKGQLLTLTATQAEELGVARYAVEARDPAAVYALYGLDPTRVKEVTPGWLDRFAEFLRQPVVTVLLVVLGFTGLILEMKVPGLTVPGILAALCFILVFWSQSRFSGEMFVLALLLFLLGLGLVGLEIFVLPGFGAPGVFGIMCMLGGLGLVTFDRVPQSGEEWGLLGVKMTQYMFGMIGAFVFAFLIARFLPKVPYANRLMLAPPVEGAGAGESYLPGAGEAAELLGAIGTTNTALRPAGVVRFGDRFADVVSDGGYVPPGTRVQVIAVENTRVVVKEV